MSETETDDVQKELDGIVETGRAKLRAELDRIMAENHVPETGWLIELSSRSAPPTWWALPGEHDAVSDGGFFTPDSLKALRFARKEDADAYICDVGWTECKATEHQWG